MKPTLYSLPVHFPKGAFRLFIAQFFFINKKIKTVSSIGAVMLFGGSLFSQEAACGTFVDPVAALEHEERIVDELTDFTKAFIQNESFRKSMVKVVPVQFHIVQMSNGTGGVSYAGIMAELEIVNERYAPDLQFAECGTAKYINSDAYYTLTSSSEGTQMSFQYNEPDVLNIYFVGDPDGYCGWGYYSTSLPTDYIVIANSCATNTSTMAHEIGHYFDLYHTHDTFFGEECVDGSNCSFTGDRFCDTPADPNLSGKVNASCVYEGNDLDNCNFQPYSPDVTNIMSYSRKACRDYFSPQQRAKILFTANNGRSYLRYDCAPISIVNSAMYCNLEMEIPDNGCSSEELLANIRVEGELAIHLGQDIFLESVDLIVDHSNIGDLEISLISPAGVEVLLSSHNGGTGNDYGNPNDCFNTVASFSMNATDFVADLNGQNTNITGQFVPEGDFQNFHDGSDPSGIWQLRICDNNATFKGTLEYVKLNFGVLPPINDNVCSAKAVDVGAAFHVISGLASSEVGEIHPGAGFPGFSCQEQNGWCELPPEPNADNSTWFTFLAPPSGQVDISMNTEDDAQFAVWSVGDCSDFNSFVEIAANDDGPSSFAPFIAGACLVPGAVYYLQVDGFDGSFYNTFITISEVGVPLVVSCPPDVTVSCGAGADPAQLGEAVGNLNGCCGTSPEVAFLDATTVVICPNNFTLIRTWSAQYNCGITAKCEQVITVEDATNPSLICPADISINCNADVSPTNTGMATATDNCGMAGVVSADEIVAGNCPNNYTVLRKWTATDECGQQSTCEQMITVKDTDGPVIACPADVTISCEMNASIASTGMATATDDCGATVVSNDETINGNCPNAFTIKRKWTATDGCNAAVFCEQIILVNDETLPTISCPDDLTVSCGADLSTVNLGMATATDNCGLDNVQSNDFIITGNCASEYAIQRTWTATDECSNQSLCEQMIYVSDSDSPIVDCPADLTVACGDDTTPDNTGMATGSDNCSAVTVFQNDIITAGSCASNRIITRRWTATDECGKQSSCEQIIRTEDLQAPAMMCPDAITITPSANGHYDLPQAEIDLLGAGSMDDCGAVSFSISQNHFTCADAGFQMIALTGTDECSNSASCQINVTVNPFLFLVNSTVTNESCSGAGDGEIFLQATALGGAVNYSINGGANFQTDGQFTNLSAGMYDMVIKVVGITEVCQITGTKEVAANASGSTWYEDADGDGFHSGISLQSCDSIPGYSTAAWTGDCNDSDANIFPGAAEMCDGFDNDCDGLIPDAELDADGDGYRVCDGDCDDSTATGTPIFPGAAEMCDGFDNDCDGIVPVEETDADADGFRLCDNDCNDSDAAIYPNAPEVCDGKDNDCNNATDEGPLETFVGDVAFTSQAEIDAWLPCFNVIDGNVIIIGNGIDTLGPLSNIIEITGSLKVSGNDQLHSLGGLENLLTVGGSLSIYFNNNLSDCCAVDSLLEIGGVQDAIFINDNDPSSECNSEMGITENCPMVSAIGGAADLRGTHFSLFPNPTNGDVVAVFQRTKKGAALQIRDTLGRLVFSQILPAGTERSVINLREEGFSDGVYFVSLLDDGVLVLGELVVVGE